MIRIGLDWLGLACIGLAWIGLALGDITSIYMPRCVCACTLVAIFGNYIRQGERLPGGDLSEADILSALAALYGSEREGDGGRGGGSDLPPDARLRRQFELLASSSRRRANEMASDSSDEEQEQEEEEEGVGIQRGRGGASHGSSSAGGGELV